MPTKTYNPSNSNLTPAKMLVWKLLTHIRDNYNKEQPWLHLPPVELQTRRDDGYRQRANGTRRGMTMSDIGLVNACELSFASTYIMKPRSTMNDGDVIYRSKAGTELHREIERLCSTHVLYKAGWSVREAASLQGKDLFVKGPTFGHYTNKEQTGKKTDNVWGLMDIFDRETGTLIEFKSIVEGEEPPKEPLQKGKLQAGLYAKYEGKVKTIVWLYVPIDLRNFDPSDNERYSVFFSDGVELATEVDKALLRANEIVALMDEVGRDNFDTARPQLNCHLGDNCKACMIEKS